MRAVGAEIEMSFSLQVCMCVWLYGEKEAHHVTHIFMNFNERVGKNVSTKEVRNKVKAYSTVPYFLLAPDINSH